MRITPNHIENLLQSLTGLCVRQHRPWLLVPSVSDTNKSRARTTSSSLVLSAHSRARHFKLYHRINQSLITDTYPQTATMVSAAYILPIALLVLYIVRSIRTYYSLKDFGGHWSAGWSRLWLLRAQMSGEMHKRFTALSRKYGEHSTRWLPSLPEHWKSFKTPIGASYWLCHASARRLRVTVSGRK